MPIPLFINLNIDDNCDAADILSDISSLGMQVTCPYDPCKPTVWLKPEGLSLTMPHQDQGKSLHMQLDWTEPSIVYGFKLGQPKRALEKAMQYGGQYPKALIDATCGLAKDTLVMASHGTHITAIESNPLLLLLLQQAKRRAADHPIMGPIVRNVDFHLGQAEYLLNDMPSQSIIYLDPMFPPSSKTALAKKPLQMLQKMTHNPCDDLTLLKTAIGCQAKRVILKRPRKSPVLLEKQLHHQIHGKTIRFDIYIS